MKSLLRIYLALSLALMLVLTGQGMAIARGASDPAGQMVLCTGTGPLSVYVDENGNPTGPPVFCPDCALLLLAAVAVPDTMALPAITGPAATPIRSAHLRGVRARTCALARAPPRMI